MILKEFLKNDNTTKCNSENQADSHSIEESKSDSSYVVSKDNSSQSDDNEVQ